MNNVTNLSPDLWSMPANVAVLTSLLLCFPGGAKGRAYGGSKSSEGPAIKKIGTVDVGLVETTPIVFRGELWRFESVKESYYGNELGKPYFRFVHPDTGRVTPPFAVGFVLGSAYVDESGKKVYVTGTEGAGGDRVKIFASKTLKDWNSWVGLELPDHGIYNTSVWKVEDHYVMMFEVGEPERIAGQRFTARFARSKNWKDWELTPLEARYATDRYTAPHCFRYLDGYYYNFYLERIDDEWCFHQYVVRSRDLVHWEQSPYNPVLIPSEVDKRIANPDLTAEQRELIRKEPNINNSDIDFCEYKGRLIINYCWGNQHNPEFLGQAVYEGSYESFLRGWFREP